MIAVKSVAGLLVLKVQAAFLLPALFAVLSQFSTMVGLVSNVSSATITTGMTVLMSRKKEPDYLLELVRAGILFSYGISFLISLACIILFFSNQSIFNIHPLPKGLLLILAITPWFVTRSSIVQAHLTSSYRLQLVSKLNNISVLVVAFCSILAIYFAGLLGGAIAIAFGQILTSLVIILGVKETGLLKLKGSVNTSKYIKELFRFSFAMIIAICAVPISQLVIRGSLLSIGMEDQAGYWSSSVRLSDVYMQFFGLLLTFYVLPKLSSYKNANESFNGFLRYLFGISLLAVLLLSTVYFFRSYIVMYVLDLSYRPVIDLLAYQLLGDFFRVILSFCFWFSYSHELRLLAIVEEVLQGVLFYIYFLYLPNPVDANHTVQAHLAASLTNLIIIGQILICILWRRTRSQNFKHRYVYK